MGELLNSFLQQAEDSTQQLSVASLLSEEERIEWETLVKALDSIDILNVGKDLEKITKVYQLKRWQEMSILAYVKVLEMMMKRAKDIDALDTAKQLVRPPKKAERTEYSGSMFG